MEIHAGLWRGRQGWQCLQASGRGKGRALLLRLWEGGTSRKGLPRTGAGHPPQLHGRPRLSHGQAERHPSCSQAAGMGLCAMRGRALQCGQVVVQEMHIAAGGCRGPPPCSTIRGAWGWGSPGDTAHAAGITWKWRAVPVQVCNRSGRAQGQQLSGPGGLPLDGGHDRPREHSCRHQARLEGCGARACSSEVTGPSQAHTAAAEQCREVPPRHPGSQKRSSSRRRLPWLG